MERLEDSLVSGALSRERRDLVFPQRSLQRREQQWVVLFMAEDPVSFSDR